MQTKSPGSLPMNPLDELEGLLEVTDGARGQHLVDLSRRLSNSIWLPTLVELAALRWSRWRAGVGDLRQLLRPPRGSNLAALLDAGANLPLVALGAPVSGRTAGLRLLEGEVVEVPAEGEDWQPGRPLARFEERFHDALVRQGYPGHGADLLSAALREMESNAAEHAWAPIAPLACYQVRAGGWAFSVTDVGCGVLDSLRRNAVYAGVTNAHDALELALRPGVSCTGERGRDHGFTTLFKSLVDRNCQRGGGSVAGCQRDDANVRQRGGGSVAGCQRDDANVRRWGTSSLRTLGVSSTSRAAHEAEDWSSEMLERRTALEFLSSNRVVSRTAWRSSRGHQH